jgi:glycosyltransferase involved in cell wall biosynthesis
MPVRDGERFVGRAIESILRQDFTDFELVVSDNGSTDGSEEICRHYADADERVRYTRQPTDRGLAWNFNHVAEISAGPLFKWAAHDDELCPSWLSSCLDALADAPGAVIAYTRRVRIDDAGQRLAVPTWTRTRPRRFLAADSDPGTRFSDFLARTTSCIELYGVIRRSALERTRMLLPFLAADRVLLAELTMLGHFVEVPEQLFRHREHPGRTSRQSPTAQTARWGMVARDQALVPTWRLGIEFARAIERSPMDPTARRAAYRGLRAWARRRSGVLANDIVDVARAGVRRWRPSAS